MFKLWAFKLRKDGWDSALEAVEELAELSEFKGVGKQLVLHPNVLKALRMRMQQRIDWLELDGKKEDD